MAEVETDAHTGKQFLKHEYNRDGDSYRSPWSNTYFPASPDATFYPSEHLLQLEQKANEVFATYVQLYYDFAVSSVYFNDTDTQGFNACFLVKKNMDKTNSVKSGTWDAIHIVVCNMKEAPKVSYKVISTVMISLEMVQPTGVGSLQIHGSSSKSASEQVTLPSDFGNGTDPDQFHISTIGRLVEANEDALRQTVQDNYINKQRQITNTGRLLEEYMTDKEHARFQELAQRGAASKSNENDEVFR